MGKKILVPCLDVIMIAFSGLVLEIWSFIVYFWDKVEFFSSDYRMVEHFTRFTRKK